jgi:hypothetical protein
LSTKKLYLIAGLVVLAVTVLAINRTITPRLERYLGSNATLIANDREHLAFATVLVTTIGTAGRTTTGLILETLFSVESLLGSGEGEFGAALAAGQNFVGVHVLHVPP